MELNLPLSIATRTDVGRVVREISGLDSLLGQAKLRNHPSQNQIPSFSRTLSDLVQLNSINLADAEARASLLNGLTNLQKNSLQIQVSFASEPSSQVIERVVDWFRKNVDPMILIQVGLQPTIAAGCVVRTPNKVFDLSLRNYFEAQEANLAQMIKGVVDGSK